MFVSLKSRFALLAAVMAFGLAPAAFAAPAPQPIVVELYTSQGCSSCPPAVAAVGTLTGRPDVLALSFGVTYWDNLGWKDTFASPAFTQRQHDYARGLGHNQVWTPQVVVDGRADTTGQSPSQIEPLIAAAKLNRRNPPAIALSRDAAVIAAAPGAPSAQVWLVRYDPRELNVPIQRGENAGRTLAHKNVVRELVKLGGWSGAEARFRLPPAGDGHLKSAILLQAGTGGPILASARD